MTEPTPSSAATPAAATVTAPGPADGPRVAIVTLGCGRNEVDSDQLAGLMTVDGMQVVADADDADVVLVNTCTFIAPAKQESVDTVLAACDLKQDAGSGGKARAVVVVGCMAQRYPDDLAESIPEADAILGFDAYPRLPGIVRDLVAGREVQRVQVGAADPGSRPAGGGAAQGPSAASATAAPTSQPRRALPLLVMPTTDDVAPPEAPAVERVTTAQDDLDRIPASGPRFPVRAFDGRPWAYLKIASGCDRVCTFCAIPSFRGRFRSRPLDELVSEAAWLAEGGARELVLVSENTTSWGKDLSHGGISGRDLQPTLLQALAEVDGIERLRLMYLQPAELQRPLLEAMGSIPEVAPYFDLSLQHASHEVLTAMARSGSPERFLTLIDQIREVAPDAAFRSNFILGFPGETEDHVAELVDFLEQARLDWVGLFPFSVEDGTPSATYPDQVPLEVAMERVEHVSTMQESIADEATARFVGRTLDVLVDDVLTDDDGSVITVAGRSWREAPETDGEVRLEDGDGNPIEVPLGRMVPTRIVAADGVDLVGVPDVEVRGRAAGDG